MPETAKPAGGWTQIYRSIFDQSIIGIVLCDMNGAILECNPAFTVMIGYTGEELSRKTVQDLTHPEDWASEQAAMARSRETPTPGRHYTAIKRYIRKDGRIIWANVNATTIWGAKDVPVFGFAIVEDITERLQAQQRLEEETERMSVVLRSISDAVVATDTEGSILLLNKLAEQWMAQSQEDAIGKPVWQILNLTPPPGQPPCPPALEEAVRKKQRYEPATPLRLAAGDGSDHWLAVSGSPMFDHTSTPVGMVFVMRDVTERLRMEAERVKTEKLDSLGHLAAGIAHDFNNLLTAIMGNVSLARTHVLTTPEVGGILAEAESALKSASTLTQQLLTFAKGGSPLKATIDTSKLVKETVEFALSGSKSRVEFSLSPTLWKIEADRTQLSQAIQSLVINADEAMPSGGSVHVSAENFLIESGDPVPLQPGRYVRISVTDSGVGIPERALDRIFDPYFTTKQHGSGMGLATARSIVRNHGGHIGVESRLGIGTTFEIYLPAIEDTSASPAPAKIPQTSPGKIRVLVMDDEEAIRNLATRILSTRSCDVTTTSTGEEALSSYETARASGNPFDVVILDLTIRGGMGGKDTIQRLRELDPSVKAIVSSGYSNDPVMSNYRRYGFRGIVPKPYQAENLVRAVFELAQRSAQN